jgi:hypothetical protein
LAVTLSLVLASDLEDQPDNPQHGKPDHPEIIEPYMDETGRLCQVRQRINSDLQFN